MNHKQTSLPGVMSWKHRDIFDATRVFVYRNLNPSVQYHSVWSIRAVDGRYRGLVVGHATHLLLDLPVFKINENGRQAVISEGRKNVHAGVVGILADSPLDDEPPWERVTYNPYTMATFVLADHLHVPVTSARVAMFDVNGKAWAA